MKHLLFFHLFLLLGLFASAQTAPNKYWVEFTDKNHSDFSVDNPGEFLSSQAIARRENQGIAITEQDIPVSHFYIDSLKKIGVNIHNVSKWFNAATIETTNPDHLTQIDALDFVKSRQKATALQSHLNELHYRVAPLMSSNSYFITDADYGESTEQLFMLNTQVLHKQGYEGQGKTIAVIDAGFYKANELPVLNSLFTNNQILGYHDFVAHDGSVFEDHDHGMKVLSIMGGYAPGDFIGAAPQASYWLLRSEDAGSEYVIEEDNWVAAAEFADSAGADIINTSLGYTEFDDISQNHSYSDMDGATTRISKAADIASDKGMLVIVSAGNSGNDEWKFISAPADARHVISVGAVNADGYYAPFSSQGPTADGRVKPNVAAMGQGTVVQTTNGTLVPGNGTSFAAPIIAGAAACLWQYFPEKTNLEIKDLIEKSSTQYDDPDYFTGYGIPDFAIAAGLTPVDDHDQFSSLQVYPNPFINTLQIKMKHISCTNCQIKLIDITGRTIIHRTVKDVYEGKNIEISGLSNIENGIYILQLFDEDFVLQKKVIKQKP